MFSKSFFINEQKLPIIERLGQQMPGGFFIYRADESEELLYANNAVCHLFGCESLDEFKKFSGFTFRGMIHPDDYERVTTSIKEQIKNDSLDTDHVEYRIIRKDGTVRWIDDYGHYAESDVYEKGLYYVFISDITDNHEKAESDKALRSAVIEALTRVYDSVWLITDIKTERFELYRIDKEMAHLLPAHAAVQITRFSDAFKFYSNLVAEDDRQQFLEAVTPENIVKNTAEKLIYSVPFRRIFETGIRYYRLEFARLDLPNGETGIVGGFKDVDEEVRKELQIQHSLRQRSAVIEALTRVYDSVWVITDMETQRFELYRIDEETVHLLPANAAMKITRFSEAFAFYSNLVLEEDRQKFLEAVTPENIIRNTADKPMYSIQFRRVFETGIRYYRLEFARLIYSGREFGVVGGFRDVDEDVRKEQQVQQALREAIDAANASSMAKGNFLSSMSHDMRTPMNGIIGMTTIALNHLDDRDRLEDCLRKIKDSSGYLLSLINEVLDLNKIESGKVELAEENINLEELIGTVMTMTQAQIQAHKHTFRINVVDIEHEQVIGDSLRLQQVFMNILSNAIKYTPDGGKISLSVKESPTTNGEFGHYQFIFEDNGYGMTEEFQKHLFEPFTRAENKQTAGIIGTGLGMAITRNIIRMMGGDITVESTYGKGSKFTINLYLKYQNCENHVNEKLIGLPVLILDEDLVLCESFSKILNDLGLKSQFVLTDQAALEILETEKEHHREFFAVFINWDPADTDWLKTVRQIRGLAGDNAVLILVSAFDWTEIEFDAREAGINSFVSKPLFRSKLVNLFNSMVSAQVSEDDEEDPMTRLENLGLKGHRILLAEDIELNAEIATDFLEMTGAAVDWAKNGEMAVKLFADSPAGYYSMIFMDIQMPKINGYKATGMIREMDRPDAKLIPIVAMSANAFTEDRLNSKKAGMNDHITKPIDLDVLAHVLSSYISASAPSK